MTQLERPIAISILRFCYLLSYTANNPEIVFDSRDGPRATMELLMKGEEHTPLVLGLAYGFTAI